MSTSSPHLYCRSTKEVIPIPDNAIDLSSLETIDFVHPNDSQHSSWAPHQFMYSTSALSILSEALSGNPAPLKILRIPGLYVEGMDQKMAFRSIIRLLSTRAKNLSDLTMPTGRSPIFFRPLLRALNSSLPAVEALTLLDPHPDFLRLLPIARPNITKLCIHLCEKPITIDDTNNIVQALSTFTDSTSSLTEFRLETVMCNDVSEGRTREIALYICEEVTTILRRQGASSSLRDICLRFKNNRTDMDTFDPSIAASFISLQKSIGQTRKNEVWNYIGTQDTTSGRSLSFLESEAQEPRVLKVDLHLLQNDALECLALLARGVDPRTTLEVSLPVVSVRFLPTTPRPVVFKISLVPDARMFLQRSKFSAILDTVRIPEECSCLSNHSRTSGNSQQCSVEEGLQAIGEFGCGDDVHTLQSDMKVVGNTSAKDTMNHIELAQHYLPGVTDLKIDYAFAWNMRRDYRRIANVFSRFQEVKRLHLMVSEMSKNATLIPSIDLLLKNAEAFLRFANEKLTALENVYLPEVSESKKLSTWAGITRNRMDAFLAKEELCLREGIRGSLRVAENCAKDLSEFADEFQNLDIGCIFRHAARRSEHLMNLQREVERRKLLTGRERCGVSCGVSRF